MPAPKDSLPCPVCEGPIVQPRMGPRLTHCSRSCRRYARSLTPAVPKMATADLVVAAGFAAERTAAEWVAHPTALDDLLRVLGGTRVAEIDADRKLAAERAA